MTHRGPFQPLLFCDSVISDSISLQHLKLTLVIQIQVLKDGKTVSDIHNTKP